MHEFDARADGEVRFLGQVSEGDRRWHVCGSARLLCGRRGQCVGRRPDRPERQGRRSHQVWSRRHGVDDFGQTGMPGNGPGYLSTGSAVVVAPDGDIYVADGHGAGTNDRIVKYSKNGILITAWGKHGKAAGEFDTPHGIALDSAGRVYVADRANNRIQIFEPDGKFVAEWKQFGRPSDVAIDKYDMIYVADSQSTPSNNPGFKQGIRIGSVKDGKVAAFIPEPSVEAGAPEGIGVDDAGNVYAGWTAKMAVRRYVQ